jgi:hypothetical protein
MSTDPIPQLYDSLDLTLLGRLFSECCEKAPELESITASEREAFRVQIAKCLFRSLAQGERNPETMKTVALREVLLSKPLITEATPIRPATEASLPLVRD